MSQVTNCDVDSIFQQLRALQELIWALDCLLANLKTEIWRWPLL